MDFHPQTFMRTDPVVVSVFPNHGGLMQLEVYEESQGLAGQAGIEQACRQMAAFDVGGAFSRQIQQFFQTAPNGSQLDFFKSPVPITVFDHLQVKPIFARLGFCGWSSSSRILVPQSIHYQHGIIDATPPIRDQRW